MADPLNVLRNDLGLKVEGLEHLTRLRPIPRRVLWLVCLWVLSVNSTPATFFRPTMSLVSSSRRLAPAHR